MASEKLTAASQQVKQTPPKPNEFFKLLGIEQLSVASQQLQQIPHNRTLLVQNGPDMTFFMGFPISGTPELPPSVLYICLFYH